MGDFLVFWLAMAVGVFATELCLDSRARRHPVMAAISAAIWPVYLPLGIWVALNPRKAERLRRRYGTAALTPTNPQEHDDE